MLAEHLTQDAQVKLYRGTVLTILKKCGEELPLDVDEQVTILCVHLLVSRRYNNRILFRTFLIKYNYCIS